MKHIFLFLCLSFILTGCNWVKETDFVDICESNRFNDSSFEKIISLTARTFNDSIISNPVGLELNDSVLWVIDAAYSSDTLVRCYSIKNRKYLGYSFLRGEGPSELLSVSDMDFSPDMSHYWTFDVTKQIWMGRSCLGRFNAMDENNSTRINLRDTALLGITHPKWLDSHRFVFTSLFRCKERFFICDSSTMVKNPVFNPSLKFKDELETPIMADIFSSHLCLDDARSRVILAGRYLDIIEIYDSNGKLLHLLKGPKEGFHFKFDYERSKSNGVLVKSPDSERAYLQVMANENHIYALYSGKKKSDKEHYSYSKCLYVFSLDGECELKYILDRPILDFVVDYQTQCIYAISIDAEIVCFELP